ncbi:MAG: hypothetical protein ACKVJE_08015 [Pseudomonadales bacterium]
MSLLEEQTFMPRLNSRIAKVLEFLKKYLSNTPPLSKIAGIACLSISQLKNLFKTEAGKNPHSIDSLCAWLKHMDCWHIQIHP